MTRHLFDDENDEWHSSFSTWEDVRSLLRTDDWTTLRDDRQVLEVQHSASGLTVYEWTTARMRARHRRGLHRLGFRPRALPHVTFWDWDVAPSLSRTTYSRHDDRLRAYADWARPVHVAALSRRLVGADLIADQVQRVVDRVFRSELRDLAVAVRREPEPW